MSGNHPSHYLNWKIKHLRRQREQMRAACKAANIQGSMGRFFISPLTEKIERLRRVRARDRAQ